MNTDFKRPMNKNVKTADRIGSIPRSRILNPLIECFCASGRIMYLRSYCCLDGVLRPLTGELCDLECPLTQLRN